MTDIPCRCGHEEEVHYFASEGEIAEFAGRCLFCYVSMHDTYCEKFRPDNLKWLENLSEK